MKAELVDRRSVLTGLGARPGLGVAVDVDQLTKIGEYDSHRAGMLMNTRPDGSFMNW